MRKLFLILVSAYATLASGVVLAVSDDEKLLNAFHKYGLTKCDKFILANSKLKGDWNFFISKHPDIDGVKEASAIQITGSKNDTVKTDDSYIQTPKACFLHSRLVAVFPRHGTVTPHARPHVHRLFCMRRHV